MATFLGNKAIVDALPSRLRPTNRHPRALSRRTRVADLSRLDGQIPEVSHGSWFKPQCNAAARVCARFDVVDHQSRLFVAVNIEPCPFAVHLDPDLRPL